ncbi:hypothetical protein V8E54_000487 [Elaphomyces granulatus]
MADGPRRLRFGPTNADCWRHETVEGHIPAPVTTRRTRRRDPSSDRTLGGPISVPVTTRRTRRRDPSPLDQTLDGHHSVPVTTRRTRRRDSLPSNQTPDGFLAAPVTTPSDLSRQRKRRRAQTEHSDTAFNPVGTLVETYKRRKKATASFPPKASPQQIRDAMYKYEQIIEDACAAVETSCDV